MNYSKIYENIINNSKIRILSGYKERHHIIPRCIGGLDDKSNLAILTAKEHFLCHLLLVKIFPDEYKLKFALNMMLKSNKLQSGRITGKKVDKYKKLNSEALSKLHKGIKKSLSHRKKISKSNKGKTFSDEHRKNLSKARKGKPGKPWKPGRQIHPNLIKSYTDPNRVWKYHGTPETQKKQKETLKKTLSPTFNVEGYQILTPSGFQKFDGVAYSGLIKIMTFTLENNVKITTSTHHRFDDTNKRADEYKINDFLNTNTGQLRIIEIENVGKKRQTFDILNVANGNLYYGNGVQHHNCDVVTEEEDAIVPEFHKKELQEKIITTWKEPTHYDGYVSMDIGFKDLTAVLYAYYDFASAKLIIKDELILSGTKMLTDNLAVEMKMKESANFIDVFTGAVKSPHLRVSDNNNPILLQDLAVKHGISFMPTAKDNFEAALNNMRMLIKQERIIIHPQCKTLIAHLKGAIWNKARTGFARNASDKSHYDCVASLIYLCRNVNFSHNPFPKESHNSNYFYNNNQSSQPSTPFEKFIKETFTPKFRRRR